jgi:hypothetical protein
MPCLMNHPQQHPPFNPPPPRGTLRIYPPDALSVCFDLRSQPLGPDGNSEARRPSWSTAAEAEAGAAAASGSNSKWVKPTQ